VLRAAGAQIARLHAAGIVHPDLNLRNILVAGAEVYLIDFDRARVLARPVSRGARARGLLRLARSARKLRAAVDPAGWAAFREGYGAGWPLRRPLG
jgi:3-deoxy-D-manno-octulosonic acid kinase